MFEITITQKNEKLSKLTNHNVKVIYCFPGYCGGFPDIFYNSIDSLISDSQGKITPDMTIDDVNKSLPGYHRFFIFKERRK
jgi:hypothetical protein